MPIEPVNSGIKFENNVISRFFDHYQLITKDPYHYEDMIKVLVIVFYLDKVFVGKQTDVMLVLLCLVLSLLKRCNITIPRTITGVD